MTKQATDRNLANTPPGVAPVGLTLEKAITTRQLLSGDWLLYRRSQKLSNRLIGISGRNNCYHAGMMVWWGGTPMIIHTVQWKGCVGVNLKSEVRKYPGQIEVRRPDKKRWPEYNEAKAIVYMREATGNEYGWWNLLRTGLRHMAVIRLFVSPPPRFDGNGGLPYCSALLDAATLAGGVDVVRDLAGSMTEPADLARTLFAVPQYVLEGVQ